jgi:hypothetical protein
MKQSQARTLHNLFPLFILLLTLALYLPALRVFFSLDDFRFLLRAAGFEDYPDSFKRLVSIKLFFGAAWRLFGTTPWPYHLVVLVLHAANARLLYILARRLGLKQIAACAASILFVATPVAFLPMHWISGIQEVTVTFFALISAYFFLGRGNISIAVSLAAAGLALLCKETSFLLLPVLALILPTTNRRKWILGLGGLLLGVGMLWAAGALTPRPAGDPYESALGVNVLWNLFTYNAWIVRVWDYYPDKTAEFQTGLAVWGLILPALLGFLAWRYPKNRRPIIRASFLFLCLLLPVLPLIRHSYLYYLYLPLIPFWLLAGSGISNLSKRSIQAGILALFIFNSVIFGIRHRSAELREELLEDPILRYAAVAEGFVGELRAKGQVEDEKHLFLMPLSKKIIDLTKGLDDRTLGERIQFTVVEKALLDGRALRLFFPAMETTHFENISDPQFTKGWQEMHLYWVFGLGEMKYLGYGERGRFKLVESAMALAKYKEALREVSIMLELSPDNPALNYIRADIALKQGDAATLQAILEKLESMAGRETAPGEASRALNALKKLVAQSSGNR